MSRRSERALVLAAQRGDRPARDAIARTCLPLVYNVVGRALGSPQETEDVVQETMLQVFRALPDLRQPEALRAWTLAIAVHQISAHRSRNEAEPAELGEESLVEDFEDLTILRLQLSGQRRQVAQAARWLDSDHRTVLAVWWQEACGQLSRTEVAEALDSSVAYAAVRIQRMHGQLDRARSVVAALEARPRCADLQAVLQDWDGRPSPLWRKRIDRHVRTCPFCSQESVETVPVGQLVAGLGLVAVPAALTASMWGEAVLGSSAVKAGAVRRMVHLTRSHPFATAAATAAVSVGTVGIFALTSPDAPPPAPQRPVLAGLSLTQPPSTTAPAATQPLVTKTEAAPRPTKPTKTTKPVALPVKTSASCDDGSTNTTWADWAMPNPTDGDLPDQARYTSAKSIVRDQVTCLEWQREASPDVHTWKAAKQYCNDLKLDGGDWHLPTRIELTSIVDPTRDNPAIDPKAFPDTTPRYFWTSSRWAVTTDPPKAWIINFYEGLASNNASQQDENHVRCVRSAGGSGGPDYEVTRTQVKDPGTGLIWQRRRSPEITPDQAEKYCKKLNIGGHEWRLPSIKELATTVDETQVAPAVDRHAFPGTVGDGRYFSSTRPSPEPSARWQLNYADGFITYRDTATGYARCVR